MNIRLSNLTKKRERFIGTVSEVTKIIFKNDKCMSSYQLNLEEKDRKYPSNEIVILKDLKLVKNNSEISEEYVWLYYPKILGYNEKFKEGDILEFDAKVVEYEKDYDFEILTNLKV
ncbi:MAG: hypothetical protein ACRCYT_04825, partial [Cetobacterium sp.]